jgi:hypothetical protein
MASSEWKGVHEQIIAERAGGLSVQSTLLFSDIIDGWRCDSATGSGSDALDARVRFQGQPGVC